MGITTSKVLRLVFNNEAGKSVSITLPFPREDLNSTEAEAAMELAIAKNLFETPGGALVGVRDIKVVDTTTNDLFDPAES